jgi:exonuclease III
MLHVTWNVNSLKVRLPRVLELLEQHRPDVACLQETKADAAAFPHMELEAAGYAAVEHGAGRWAGVAILAREGLELSDPLRGLPGRAGGGGGSLDRGERGAHALRERVRAQRPRRGQRLIHGEARLPRCLGATRGQSCGARRS